MEAMKREIVLKSFLENKERIDTYVNEGIEKYRKGDFTLKFAKDGKKKVKITHKKHSFLFGSTAFMLDSFEKEGKDNQPIFRVTVTAFGKTAKGEGGSKKQAEANAASALLKALKA